MRRQTGRIEPSELSPANGATVAAGEPDSKLVCCDAIVNYAVLGRAAGLNVA
jgi:hypothetical protein